MSYRNAMPRLYLDTGAIIAPEPLFEGAVEVAESRRLAPELINRLGQLPVDVAIINNWESPRNFLDDIDSIPQATIDKLTRGKKLDTAPLSLQNWRLLTILSDQEQRPSPFMWIDAHAKAPEDYDTLAGSLRVGHEFLVAPVQPANGITPTTLRVMERFVDGIIDRQSGRI